MAAEVFMGVLALVLLLGQNQHDIFGILFDLERREYEEKGRLKGKTLLVGKGPEEPRAAFSESNERHW